MTTLQHVLVTLLSVEGDIQKFRNEIAYVLLPDAIRKYTGVRQTSHFESNCINNITSWMKYPLNIKELSKENINETVDQCLSPEITPCCIGETTQIDEFYKHNKHLPLIYRLAVEKHLIQDWIYDDFIRSVIDVSEKFEGIFYYNNTMLDSTEIRKLIAKIEEDGFIILAKLIYSKYRIKANQDWLDKNVYEVLKKIYPEDLADTTYSYMKIREDVNKAITNNKWRSIKFNTKICIDKYSNTYFNMIERCKQLTEILDTKTVRCIRGNRDTSLAIKTYKVEYINKETSNLTPEKLAFYITNDSVYCPNLDVTKDGRLIAKEAI